RGRKLPSQFAAALLSAQLCHGGVRSGTPICRLISRLGQSSSLLCTFSPDSRILSNPGSMDDLGRAYGTESLSPGRNGPPRPTGGVGPRNLNPPEAGII